MKRIVGIGNALVDVVAIIPDERYLGRFSLPKGSMTMVDASRSGEIRQAINSLQKKLVSGGSVGNTMHGLGILGVDSSFIGKVGDDEFGNFYEKEMAEAGLKPVLMRAAATPTGTAVTLVTPDSERTFATHLGAATELMAEELTGNYFKGYDILYVEGYLIYNLPLVEQACRLAQEKGMTIALDLASYNVVNEMLPQFNSIVTEYVDILFSNQDEASAFTGAGTPQESLNIIADKCDIAVVKTGAGGSWIKRDHEVIRVDPLRVSPVDTTGAGDLYAAGFLYGLSNGFTLDKCGLFGSTLAGKVIEVIGARMPEEKWREAKELIQQISES